MCVCVCVCVQLFTVPQYEWQNVFDEGISKNKQMASLKRDRLAIAEILLRAGACGDGKFFTGYRPRHWEIGLRDHDRVKVAKEDPNPVVRADFLHAYAGMNSESGGPEVVQLIDKSGACPRQLKATCRIAIRKLLTKPIFLAGDVAQLPLSSHMKSYVAMETV